MEKKAVKKEVKKKKDKYETQLKWVFAFAIVLILVVIATYFLVESLKRFQYAGLKFEKIMFDKLPLYYSKIPFVDESGNLKLYYNLYLKNDPRKLDYIEISGIIRADDNVRISLDRASENECDGREILRNLAELVTGTGNKLTIGFNDLELAKEKNMSYFTCDNADVTTFVFKSSNSTRITQKGNCYELEFDNCKVREVTERFIVGWFAHAKGVQI